MESYPYSVKEGQQYINLNPGRLLVQQPPKGKRLKLSTPNFVHVYSIAVAWHALTQRSKGQRSRSHGYKNRHSCTVSDAFCYGFELLQPIGARTARYNENSQSRTRTTSGPKISSEKICMRSPQSFSSISCLRARRDHDPSLSQKCVG